MPPSPSCGGSDCQVGASDTTVVGRTRWWHRPLFNELLALPPAVYIGKLSYPLYLWHWPMLVLAAEVCRARSQP